MDCQLRAAAKSRWVKFSLNCHSWRASRKCFEICHSWGAGWKCSRGVIRGRNVTWNHFHLRGFEKINQRRLNLIPQAMKNSASSVTDLRQLLKAETALLDSLSEHKDISEIVTNILEAEGFTIPAIHNSDVRHPVDAYNLIKRLGRIWPKVKISWNCLKAKTSIDIYLWKGEGILKTGNRPKSNGKGGDPSAGGCIGPLSIVGRKPGELKKQNEIKRKIVFVIDSLGELCLGSS